VPEAASVADRDESSLLDFALGYPETRLEFPWGERAVKVNKKVFVFANVIDDGLGISVKLPQSAQAALQHRFAEPTGYGLGKSGWVSARFAPGKKAPLPMLQAWIDESYRAVAPKRLVDQLPPPTPVRTSAVAGARREG
jgi:predicted DNA-binding protein (MmcQ/YjbR family)